MNYCFIYHFHKFKKKSILTFFIRFGFGILIYYAKSKIMLILKYQSNYIFCLKSQIFTDLYNKYKNNASNIDQLTNF